MSELSLYVKYKGKLYRLHSADWTVLGIERQASDGIPSGIYRHYPLGTIQVFDGIAWDLDIISDLLARYEFEATTAKRHTSSHPVQQQSSDEENRTLKQMTPKLWDKMAALEQSAVVIHNMHSSDTMNVSEMSLLFTLRDMGLALRIDDEDTITYVISEEGHKMLQEGKAPPTDNVFASS